MNGQNIITLQLTVPALEKLFEGDPEFRLHLAKSVMAEFAKRSINGLLSSAGKRAVQEEVKKHIGSVSTSFGTCVDLVPEIGEVIKKEAKKQIDEALESYDIKVEIDRRINYEVMQRINTGVREKISQIMKEATQI